MAFSFSTQGALPQTSSPMIPGLGGDSTPASKALSNALQTGSTAYKPAPVTIPSAPPPPTNQSVKRQTVKTAAGDTHITDYNDTTAGLLAANKSNQKTQEGDFDKAPQGTPAPTSSTPPAPVTTPTNPEITNKVLDTAQGNIPIGQEADAIAKKYAGAFQALEPQFRTGGLLTTGTTPVAQGRAASALATGESQANVLTQGENAEMAGITPQLTAQNQAAGAQETAQTATLPGNKFIQQAPANTLVGANGQPIQQVSPDANGGFTNAMTGQPLKSTGNPQLDNAVANALNYIKAGAGYSNALTASGLSAFSAKGTNALGNELPPGFDTNASDAQASANATNIGTRGTTQNSAAATGYTQAVQQQADATAKYQALTGVSSQVESTLKSWANKYDITAGNQALNTIAGLTSDPNYQPFVVAMNNTKAAYQAALGSLNVAPTQAQTDALQALNPNSSGTAIISALNQLSKDAHTTLIEPAYQKTQSFASQLGIQ